MLFEYSIFINHLISANDLKQYKRATRSLVFAILLMNLIATNTRPGKMLKGSAVVLFERILLQIIDIYLKNRSHTWGKCIHFSISRSYFKENSSRCRVVELLPIF